MRTDPERREWLFVYGSLVADGPRTATRDLHPDGVIADLPGYRRTWGVAMDNRVDIPGYKFYVDRLTNERPLVRVAFLDIEPEPHHVVNGICRPVTPDELRDLDAREQQYVRIDVGAGFPMIASTVWTYVGSASGRERRRDGDSSGATVVAQGYRDLVLAGFNALGPDERAAFDSSTAPCSCPVVPLVRRELPPAADRGASAGP
jgi:hypothetical protein